MTFVVGNSFVEIGRGFLCFRLFGVEAHLGCNSGLPFWHISKERSDVGTQAWALV